MRSRAIQLWLIKRIRKYIPAILLMVLFNVCRGLLEVAFALGTRQVIDTAVGGTWERFYPACVRQGGIILGLIVCLMMFRLLKERINAGLDREWKRQILHCLLNGEYAGVSAYHSGELINRMTNDVRAVNDGLLNSLPALVTMVIKLIAVISVLIRMEPAFAAMILCVGVVVIILTGLLRRKLKTINKQVSEADGKVSGMLQEIMEKLLMVQAMDAGAEMEIRADRMMEERFGLQMKRKNISLFANTSVSVMSYGSAFVALLYGATNLLNGTMTFGGLTALTQLVSQLQSPFVNLSGIYPKYVAMLASAERLRELYDLQEQKQISELDVNACYASMTHIEAKGLSFTYDRTPVFSGADFCLPKGAFAVVTGSSGIGKSTLLKLLLGIYLPESGGLYLCGKDTEIRLDRSTRRLFSYVPQGNLLLSGTIRENLLLGRPEATEEEIKEALYVSAMDEYLNELPLGLETPLKENAGGLSEGQAQRLALARGILSGAPILLLDEVTSALDEETELKVLDRIKKMKDRTCIAVTHRPAAVQLCDRHIRIEYKKIASDTTEAKYC